MANYFVSDARGNDTTGDGSAATPWKTIGKAIGSSPAITMSGSGDTLYIEPGIYRELVTIGVTPSSGNVLTIVGDGDGAGFQAAGYSPVRTGLVEIRGWSDDVTPLTASEVVVGNGKSYVTIRNVKIIGGTIGSYGCFNLTAGGTNWTWEFCTFQASGTRTICGAVFVNSGVTANITFRRCLFCPSGGGYGVDLRPQLASSEWNMGVVFESCIVDGGGSLCRVLTSGGSGSAMGSGITVRSCTMRNTSLGGFYVQSNPTMTTPYNVQGCLFIGGVTGVQANNTSQILEDWNCFSVTTTHTNTNVGSNSKTAICPAINLGDERLYGGFPRPYLEPSAVGAHIGAAGYSSPLTTDFFARQRPNGTGSTTPTAGAIERHDTGAKDATYHDSAGGSAACLKLVGPSSQERPVLVSDSATVISVKVRWDGNHGDSAKPRAVLLANPEIGVAEQTVTATSAGGSGATPNSYETLTFSSISPTAAGVVMLRLISRSAAGNGAAYFDAIALS